MILKLIESKITLKFPSKIKRIKYGDEFIKVFEVSHSRLTV